MAVLGTQTVNWEAGGPDGILTQYGWFPWGTQAAETATVVAAAGGISIYTKHA